MKKEIEIINNIVLQAIKHGADNGGNYENNEEKLRKALEEYIKEKKLKSYKIERIAISENGEMWGTYQITKKGALKNGN